MKLMLHISEHHANCTQNCAHAFNCLCLCMFLYLAIFIIIASGYFISTADGRAINVFQWIQLPSFGELFSNQEDISGTVHTYVAYSVVFAAVLHAAAALKHHFIDKDKTLMRMLGQRKC